MTATQPTVPATPPLDGFILTRHGRDVRGRNGQPATTEIVMWLWSAQGPVRVVVPGQEPVFFCHRATWQKPPSCSKGPG